PGATCYPALVCTALYALSQGISLLICRHGLGQGFEFRISTCPQCLCWNASRSRKIYTMPRLLFCP
ncbi:MAG: hypothetical protein KKI12_13975, partial [Proteobacteria bacterium]|nr:hypothetical protein [Pseudomonadota bacterium]